MTHPYQDLKEAAMKATPGPWDGSANHGYVTSPTGDIADVLDGVVNGVNGPLDFGQARANAAFIALARNKVLSLLEENQRLRKALTPFAAFVDEIEAHETARQAADSFVIHEGLTVGDFRRARAALKEKPHD